MSAGCASDQHYPATNRVTPRKSGRKKKGYIRIKRLSDDKLAPPHRRFMCLSLYVCLIDPSVIRRDGFAVKNARGRARRPRESFETLIKN
ncbi:hypothetical protein ALC62_15469 [Cyphomyrmex costatus]|uniref:Uncharacterized protein n=1 Tax=Cyphomyrmex costatus TaxID=456900 RepID=A0A151I720_9HYME|nr:hypothetical protein ALC62_15469 [Cyphomyrmex costatus]